MRINSFSNRSFGKLSGSNSSITGFDAQIEKLKNNDKVFALAAKDIIAKMENIELEIKEVTTPKKKGFLSIFKRKPEIQLMYTGYCNFPNYHCDKRILGGNLISALKETLIYDMQLGLIQEIAAKMQGKSQEQILKMQSKRTQLYKQLKEFSKYLLAVG